MAYQVGKCCGDDFLHRVMDSQLSFKKLEGIVYGLANDGSCEFYECYTLSIGESMRFLYALCVGEPIVLQVNKGTMRSMMI